MRWVPVCAVFCAGCAATIELRDDVDTLNERIVALDRRLERVREDLDDLKRAGAARTAELRERRTADIDALQETVSRTAREVGDLRQDLNHSLDQAVASMRGEVKRLQSEIEKAAAARALLVSELEAKARAAAAALDVPAGLDSRLKALEEKVGEGPEGLRAGLEGVRADADERRAETERLRERLVALEASSEERISSLGGRVQELSASVERLEAAREKPGEGAE